MKTLITVITLGFLTGCASSDSWNYSYKSSCPKSDVSTRYCHQQSQPYYPKEVRGNIHYQQESDPYFGH